MPWPVTINGNTYQASDFSPYGYVSSFPNIIADVAFTAQLVENARAAAEQFNGDTQDAFVTALANAANSVAQAAGYAGDALTQATNAAASSSSASSSRDLAAASAGQAGTGAATTLLYPELKKAVTTAGDIVDLFVYDTANDILPEGAAPWPSRLGHTSLHRATLNTSTRGARRDHPRIGLGQLRSGTTNTFQIFDRTDLDGSGNPRMWWTVPSSSGGLLDGVPTALFACQGRWMIASSTGLYIYDLLADKAFRHDVNGVYEWSTGLGLSGSWRLKSASGAIAATACVGLRAKVYPGAVVGNAMPIPTIDVTTASGTSIIHPWGAVYDLNLAAGPVAFTDDGFLAASTSGTGTVTGGPIIYADVASSANWRTRFYTVSTSATAANLRFLGNSVSPTSITKDAIGSVSGLTMLAEEPSNFSNGMVSYHAINYATGWQPGDIRGAFLCDTTTGNLVGAVIVSNDCSVATGFTAGTNWAHDAGNAEFDKTGGASGNLDLLLVGLVVGQTYYAEVQIANYSAGAANLVISGGSLNIVTGINANGTYWGNFTATNTSHNLRVSADSAFTGSVTSLKVSISSPDRSYKNKGLVANGTIARAAVATNADMAWHSGFSASNYFEQPFNSDLQFADADFAVMGWFQCAATTALETLFMRDSPSTGARFGVQIAATTSVLQFYCNDGTDAATAASTAAVDDGLTHFFCAVMRGTTMELWVDGERVGTASATSVDSLNNSSAILRLGLDAQGANPGTNVKLAMVRPTAYAPTPAQIAKIYSDERVVFQTDAKVTLGGTSNTVTDLDYDDARGVLIVGTGDGAAEFNGLVRIAGGYLDTASVTPLTNDNMKAVASQGGVRFLAGGTQSVVFHDAIVGVDVMQRAGPKWPQRMRGSVRTTDATATSMAPRIYVGEREAVEFGVRVVGRQVGPTATETCEYTVTAAAKRDAGGNVTVTAATTTVQESTGTMDATVVADTTAQTLAVQVTGKAATTIFWTYELIGNVVRTSEELSYAA